MESVPVALVLKINRVLLYFVLTLFCVTASMQSVASSSLLPRPDMVLVEKSEKKLYLLKDGDVVKEYPIALGKNPIGHKFKEGDGRTPEGRYTLDWSNPESKFHRSIQISYPNEKDVEWASDRKVPAGGFIMIHVSPDWGPSSEWAAA